MKREKLHELAAAYDKDRSETSLNALKAFLKQHTINFERYYYNTEGRDAKKTANFREQGRFLDFTESIQFRIPSLLKVQKSDGEIIYVSLNDFDLE